MKQIYKSSPLKSFKFFCLALCFTLTLGFTFTLHARPQPGGIGGEHGAMGGGRPGGRHGGHHLARLAKHLIPPHLIMRHLDKLDLSEEQIQQMKTLMNTHRSKAMDLEFDLNQAIGKLEKMLEEDQDTQTVLTQADQVMQIETQLKRTRLALALKVKKLLNSEQLKTMKKIKRKQNQWRRKKRRARRALQDE